MIRHLTSQSIPVILVSARPLNAILPTFRAIGIPDDHPLVSLNGSYIVQREQPIFDARIDLDVARAVSEKVRPFKATIAYYLQREWFAEVKDTWTDHEQRQRAFAIGISHRIARGLNAKAFATTPVGRKYDAAFYQSSHIQGGAIMGPNLGSGCGQHISSALGGAESLGDRGVRFPAKRFRQPDPDG